MRVPASMFCPLTLNNTPVLAGTSPLLSAPVKVVAQDGQGWKEFGDLSGGGGEEVGTHLRSWILREVAQNLLCPHQ